MRLSISCWYRHYEYSIAGCVSEPYISIAAVFVDELEDDGALSSTEMNFLLFGDKTCCACVGWSVMVQYRMCYHLLEATRSAARRQWPRNPIQARSHRPHRDGRDSRMRAGAAAGCRTC